jgi:hypothetical protein
MTKPVKKKPVKKSMTLDLIQSGSGKRKTVAKGRNIYGNGRTIYGKQQTGGCKCANQKGDFPPLLALLPAIAAGAGIAGGVAGVGGGIGSMVASARQARHFRNKNKK